MSRNPNIIARRPRPLTPRHATFAAAARACVESLEERQMFAVTASLGDGILTVKSDAAADTITLDHSGKKTFVNGEEFQDASVNRIIVDTGGGADTVNVRAIARPT